jgi:ATP-dependent helicase/nuclease subunit A
MGMSNINRLQQVLDLQLLTDSQKKAVIQRGKDLIVTAGAGSGKTRTLVARYLALLAEGTDLRKVAAITFTEKAAREMRNRVRTELHKLQSQSKEPEDQAFWGELAENLDGARIGTIHGLCAEILKTHPAEAVLDPEFGVLDEGLSKLLKIEAAGMALASAVEKEDFQALFAAIETRTLNSLLVDMLKNRLDYLGHEGNIDAEDFLLNAIKKILATEAIGGNIQELKEMQTSGDLEADAKTLAPQLEGLLESWSKGEKELKEGNLFSASHAFFAARRSGMDLRKGPRKGSIAKEMLRELRTGYDDLLNPWIGGKNTKDELPSEEVEKTLIQVLPLFKQVLDQALVHYQEQRELKRSLDFDDLELQAQILMGQKTIQSLWQDHISHLLVDEFQDTNQRQRDIILAIAGEDNGKLFFVGDAQQSIYRFRGADVEVFVEMQDLILSRGGISLELETTFRSHKPLLESLDGLLATVIGTEKDSDKPYAVPYLPMLAFRQINEGANKKPFVEFVLGLGEDADQGRAVAAQALAEKLISMKTQGEINSWDEVALLFRASGGFGAYEEAFSLSGIPYVTVGGIGFYQRPEIRDLLNMLSAISNPWDDTAMVGLLRSPAVGLKDSDIYLLRVNSDSEKESLFLSIQNSIDRIPDIAQRAVLFANQILEEFIPLANHIPVAELLTKLVNFIDYRAILMAAGSRVVRNLDKLLEDARESETMQISAFLEYINSIRESGVRSGEAVSEAQDSVQLMTIHKSKGLEFPFVVLADAGRSPKVNSAPGLILPETGVTLKLGRLEQEAMLYKYALMLYKAKNDAEEYRLLYVACTRTQEKLIVSGHIKTNGKGGGYLKMLDFDYSDAINEIGSPIQINIDEQEIGLIVHSVKTLENTIWEQPMVVSEMHKKNKRLYKAIVEPDPLILEDSEGEESDLKQRDWRATGSNYAPAVVVGKLVHKAIQRWLFPGEEGYLSLMRAALAREGIVEMGQQNLVLEDTEILLDRFKEHDIYQELTTADVRRHEIPFSYLTSGKFPDTGIIDMLYKVGEKWHLLDFKTDDIANEIEVEEKILLYRDQLLRYRQASIKLLGSTPNTKICFLNFMGQVKIVEVL